jgi:competence ComEA-like helix-hairpin-helix protein
MKRNRFKEESTYTSAEKSPQKDSADHILAFIVLALLILAVTVLFNPKSFWMENISQVSPDSTEKYVWLSGSSGMEEGLYLFTPEELQTDFPEINALLAEDGAQGENPVVQAIHYDTASARPELLPPQVANVFLQPIPINRADENILASLPGIGPVLAERIVQRRNQHGPFQAKEELLEVNGIGPKKYAGLVDRITLE